MMQRRRSLVIAALAASSLLAAACSDSDTDDAETSGADAELVGSVTIAASPNNALAATITAETTEVAAVAVVATSTDGHTVEMAAGEPDTSHDLVLMGLRPEQSYEVVLNAGGTEIGATSLETPPLPEGFPEFTLGGSSPGSAAAGLTLMNVIPFSLDFDPDAEPAATDAGFIVMVDSDGEVVWYHGPLDHPVIGVALTPENTVMFSYNHMTLREIDLLGNTVGEWVGTVGGEKMPEDMFGRPFAGPDAVLVPVDSLHHEIQFLEDGSVLTLDSALEEIVAETQLCADHIDDGDGRYPIVSDDIVILDRSSDEITLELPLFEALDPNSDPASSRVCDQPPTLTQVPNFMYPEVTDGVYDWTHANAVVLDETNNQYIVSVRHFDALVSIRATDDDGGPAGELLWTMGLGGDFELTSGEWWSYQHSPEIGADGTILLYDNGNRRPGAPGEVAPGELEPGEEFEHDPDNPPYSRAVLISYDIEDMTVTQLWEHRLDLDGDSGLRGNRRRRRPLDQRKRADHPRNQHDRVLCDRGRSGRGQRR